MPPWRSHAVTRAPLLFPLLLVAALTSSRTAAAAEDEPMLRHRTLSEWLGMLREDPAPEKRRAALLAVELIGPGKSPKVVPAVIAALRDDSDEKLREAAAAALGRIGERLAARSLAEKTPFAVGRDAL